MASNGDSDKKHLVQFDTFDAAIRYRDNVVPGGLIVQMENLFVILDGNKLALTNPMRWLRSRQKKGGARSPA